MHNSLPNLPPSQGGPGRVSQLIISLAMPMTSKNRAMPR